MEKDIQEQGGVDHWREIPPSGTHPGPVSDVPRRKFLLGALGFAGLLATPTLSLALVCPTILTPRQTRGPFFPFDHVVAHPIRETSSATTPLVLANDDDLTRVQGRSGVARGQVIYFRGQLLRSLSREEAGPELCQPLPSATVVLWQANASGRYNHRGDSSADLTFSHPKTGTLIERVYDEHFQYFGKAITDEQGRFQFKTILPGFYPAADDWYRPPHLHFSVRAKGVSEFVTQTYFTGEDLPEHALIDELNAKDWILRDSRIPTDQQERVIVEFHKDPTGQVKDGLVGSCQMLIPA